MRDTVWVQLVTAQAEAASHSPRGITDIVLEVSGVVLGVMVLLGIMSAISWFIIGYKALYLHRARKDSLAFLEVFWQDKRLDAIYQSAQQFEHSPIAQVFKAGYIELSRLKSLEGGAASERLTGIENVERSLRRAHTAEMTQLESKLPFLATVGSNAPFIGLFGTVWGIMLAFVNLSAANATGIDVVAGPIAEALIVTAFGLFAAIPAGISYNWFLSKIRVLSAEMDNFASDFLNITKRHFLN